MIPRKTGAVLMAISMTILLLLTGCNAAPPSAAPAASPSPAASAAPTAVPTAAPTAAPTSAPPSDPWGKYPETVSLTTDTVFAGWMSLESGEDQDNNWWTNMYLNKLNIKLTNTFAASEWGTDFDQKFNQALAADDLPDIIYAYTTHCVQCIDNNKVIDLTDLYNKDASDQLKALYAQDDNALKAWAVDGKIYGVPTATRGLPGRTGFWIRKDWLDALGLPVPKTIDDVENVMKEFAQKNPGKTAGGVYGFGVAWDSPFFNDAFPQFDLQGGNWFDNNGQLMFDKLQPGMTVFWQKAADWYKEGILPKDFAVKKNDPDINQDIVNDKVGVWWGYFSDVAGSTPMLDLKKKEPNIDFVFVYPPTISGKQPHNVIGSSYGNVLMVNVKCKYPEALFKLYNLSTAINNEPKPDFIKDMSYQHGATGAGWAEFWRCVGMGSPTDPFQADKDVKAAQAALSSGDTSKLTFIAKNEYYDKMKAWLDQGQKDPNWITDWSTYWVDGPGGTNDMCIALNASKEDYSYSPWWGMDTQSMTKNGENWNQKYLEYRTMAIVNNDVQKQFDAWVAFFKANGGDQATKEVNDWYATHK